jgi:hypothetical protein
MNWLVEANISKKQAVSICLISLSISIFRKAFLDIDVYMRFSHYICIYNCAYIKDGVPGYRCLQETQQFPETLSTQKADSHQLYLSATSHHHLANKQAILSTLVHRAKAISNLNSSLQKLKSLHQTFQEKACSKQQILWAPNPPVTAPPQHKKDPALVFLPFIGTIFNCTSRVLSKQKMVGLPPRKLPSFL